MNGVEFTPPANDLYRNAPLDFAAEFPVLGIPVRFESNGEAVIRVADPGESVAFLDEMLSQVAAQP